MNGLFLIGREMFDHPIVGLHKPKWFAAWVWMLGEARWKPHKIMVSGKTVILERGQLSCSLRFMAKRLDMSVKGIRTFLDRLESDTMIDTEKGTGQTIITICNYDIYQDFEEYRAQVGAQKKAQQGHSRGTARAQTRTPETPETPETKDNQDNLFGDRNQENKGKKKSIEYSLLFLDWWKLYPAKSDKPKAFDVYKKITNGEITHEDLMNKTQKYIAHCKAKDIYHKGAWRWLRDGRYEDEYETSKGVKW